MGGIFLGDKQVPRERRDLLMSDIDAWRFGSNDLEFVVYGTVMEGPDELRLEVARRVATASDQFIAAANEYLTECLAKERFDASGDWKAEWFEFGKNPNDSVNEFELCLVIDGDTYGVWRVRFKDAGAPLHYVPVQFSRSNA